MELIIRCTSQTRIIVLLRSRLKRFLNIPIKVKIIRLSGDVIEDFGGKKELNKNILTETRYYKDKEVITVKTDIKNKYLRPIPN